MVALAHRVRGVGLRAALAGLAVVRTRSDLRCLRPLLSLTAQGQDTTAAALTLWREFHTARAAIVAILDAA